MLRSTGFFCIPTLTVTTTVSSACTAFPSCRVTLTAQYNTTYEWIETLQSKWDFGDGQTSKDNMGDCHCEWLRMCKCLLQLRHTYTDPGDYAATVGIYTADDQPLEGLEQTKMAHIDAVRKIKFLS